MQTKNTCIHKIYQQKIKFKKKFKKKPDELKEKKKIQHLYDAQENPSRPVKMINTI